MSGGISGKVTDRAIKVHLWQKQKVTRSLLNGGGRNLYITPALWGYHLANQVPD